MSRAAGPLPDPAGRAAGSAAPLPPHPAGSVQAPAAPVPDAHPEEDVEQQMEALRQFKQVPAAAHRRRRHRRRPAADEGERPPHLAGGGDHRGGGQSGWAPVEPNATAVRRGGGQRPAAVLRWWPTASWGASNSATAPIWIWCSCTAATPTATPTARKPIDSRQFYLRLAQRILHLFSTRTPSGILYEIDMRLRPSGDARPAGLIAVGL